MRHPDDGLLEEYLDDELPDGARAELEAHVAGCEACRDRLGSARAVRAEADDLVALLGEPSPPVSTELPPALARAPRRPRWRAPAWAATVVIAAGLGYAGGASRGPVTPVVTSPTGSLADAPAPAEPGGPVAAAEEAEATAPAAPAPVPSTPPASGEARRRERISAPAAPAPVPSADQVAEFAAEARPAAKQQATDSPSLDPAIRALGGSIRLLDGLEVQRVVVEWLPMPGNDSAAVVELTYADAAGRPIVLRQNRLSPVAAALAEAARAARPEGAAQALAPARAAGRDGARAEAPADGELTWTDPAGFRLVLRADADADSLERLRARVK